MSNAEAIERAKADLQELNKKINVLDMERMRMEAQKMALVRERDQVMAFVKLVDKYMGPPAEMAPDAAQPTAQPDSDSPATDGNPKGAVMAAGIARPKRRTKKKRSKVSRIPRKPNSIPTMPDMILESLRMAKAKGKEGLAPRDMRAYIAKKWWPDVPRPAVSPVAWRMHHVDHTLDKDGDIYKLPEAA